MRILVLTNLFPPNVLGGYEILCAQVVDRFRDGGHEVRVLASDHGGQPPDDPSWVVRRLRLTAPFDRPVRGRQRVARWQASRDNAATMRRQIEAFRPDVVHAWSLLRVTVGPARAAQAAGVPVVFSVNDEHLAGFLPARRRGTARSLAAWAADRWLAPGATLAGVDLGWTTCISRTLRDRLRAQGLPVGDSVIYQGIPTDRFPPKDDPGSLHDPMRLLYAGQLHDYKGVHVLLEAADRLARQGMRVAVTIAGDGPADYKARLEAFARGSAAPVAFLGRLPQDRLAAVYRTHDVLVFPSEWAEPFGLTHLEAMASGTVVISTAHGGQGEFLEDGINARVFPAGDAGALADRIAAVREAPDLARRIAAAARARVLRDFTVDRYAASLEALLAQAAAAAAWRAA